MQLQRQAEDETAPLSRADALLSLSRQACQGHHRRSWTPPATADRPILVTPPPLSPRRIIPPLPRPFAAVSRLTPSLADRRHPSPLRLTTYTLDDLTPALLFMLGGQVGSHWRSRRRHYCIAGNSLSVVHVVSTPHHPNRSIVMDPTSALYNHVKTSHEPRFELRFVGASKHPTHTCRQPDPACGPRSLADYLLVG